MNRIKNRIEDRVNYRIRDNSENRIRNSIGNRTGNQVGNRIEPTNIPTNVGAVAYKVYIDVIARFDKEGDMVPVSFVWEDGKTYEIDKVKSKARRASLKAGGIGIMYTVMVLGKECHMYFELDKWFMERSRIIKTESI